MHRGMIYPLYCGAVRHKESPCSPCSLCMRAASYRHSGTHAPEVVPALGAVVGWVGVHALV